MTEIKFKCPHGDHDAIFFTKSGFAGCVIHGVLLYTDIPFETWKEHENVWAVLSNSVSSESSKALRDYFKGE